MKTLYCYLTVAFLVFLGACDTKDEVILPSDISNVTATSGRGEVILKWDLPEDSESIFYVKVSYYDHWRKKDRSVLASNKGDSVVITGLLNRFGEYNFTLQCYSITQTPNTNVHSIAVMCKPVLPSYVFTGAVTEIPLTAEMLSSNAQQSTTENTVADLIDRNDETFFHSQWSPVKELPHWIDITFGDDHAYDAVFGHEDSKCGAINFRIKTRSGVGRYNQAPKDMAVFGSTDGNNFVLLTDTIKGITLSDDVREYASASISLLDFEDKYGKRPKVFRFSSVSPCQEGKYFTLSEFWLFGYEAVIENPEADPID